MADIFRVNYVTIVIGSIYNSENLNLIVIIYNNSISAILHGVVGYNAMTQFPGSHL